MTYSRFLCGATLALSVSAATPARAEGEPPIECPLHKQGVDPSHLKPFADVEKYIAFLERPDRAAWQKPDAVVAALGLAGTETVVDLGAGSGYFTFRFARALGAGKVVASDIAPEMILPQSVALLRGTLLVTPHSSPSE